MTPVEVLIKLQRMVRTSDTWRDYSFGWEPVSPSDDEVDAVLQAAIDRLSPSSMARVAKEIADAERRGYDRAQTEIRDAATRVMTVGLESDPAAAERKQLIEVAQGMLEAIRDIRGYLSRAPR